MKEAWRDGKKEIPNDISESLDTPKPEALYYLWIFLVNGTNILFFFFSLCELGFYLLHP